ncbi:uncharacterized protein LOC133332680 [Musca vetustissima]|uniref:uncharacterized protein LOC133332680 n=1 Tax=Musca vetustissima TaxID=27455 RepID=UPI002AB5FDCB|nr:uncharacterized protein LOC133332680 [Musca vetustissima]
MTKRARKSSHGKHLIIHVPLKIRTHHHMHTVYTHVQGGGGGGGKHGNDGGGGGGGGRDSSKGATKQTIYKIMGYSTHHTSAGPVVGGGGTAGRGFGHGYGHSHRQGHRHHHGNRGGGGVDYGEINYDDYTNTNCGSAVGGGGGGGDGVDDSLAHGDMIFNHYSRQDEDDYPDLEELIEDERERDDEWEE